MTTRELSAEPEVLYGEDEMEIRYKWGKVARKVQRSRENSALIVFLFGLGVLILSVGLFTDVIGPGAGVVGGVASWVAAFVAREYLTTSEHHDTIEFDA